MSSIRFPRLSLAVCLLIAASVAHASADQAPPAAFASPAVVESRLDLPFAIEGPPPPDLPATSARDTEGRTTVRAVRLSAPLRLDGQLDETIYTTVTPISEFIQTEPMAAAPATERTEVWISFDSDNIYVSVRASESQPERMIVNEMRRDGANVTQNENFGFALDTFYDRRNSVNFNFNPLGGRVDGQNTNEGTWNGDWNPIWELAVRRGPDGWTAEAAVPFKSLRYQAGTAQIWGVQLRRINRWKNEVSFLTQVPDGSGNNGLSRTSQFATLVGVEAPGSRMFDVKPFVTADVTRNAPSPGGSDVFGRDVGFDVKYGVTRGLTGDVTYNTDFAQVEADEQQVNLTRFSLFFPEKRDFFLENQGIFNFGGAGNFGRRHADAVLQPADRPRPGAGHSHRGWRAADWTRGCVQYRAPQYSDRRRRRRGDPLDEFQPGAREARHPATKRDRRDRHAPLADQRWHRCRRDIRRGWHVCVLHEPLDADVLGEDVDARARRE